MSDIAERSLHTRTARSVEAIRRSFVDNLYYITGKTFEKATPVDHYIALAYTVRDRLLSRMISSSRTYKKQSSRSVAYLSAEFLIGPQLGNNILSLDIWDHTSQAMQELGLDMETIMGTEPEPGLGNGGLGRLAACYLDSLATLGIPAIGYGIRYEYGIFDQEIHDGWQVEVADDWLRNGNPWELPNLQRRYPVKLGGHTESYVDDEGSLRVRWIAETTIHGLAYDVPILGNGVINVNLLRLWKAEAKVSFDFQSFNSGDYYGAVDEMVAAQNLSKVLYPNDEPEAGKILRLRQQYFFVTCSLQDMLRITLRDTPGLAHFPEKFVVQLNDTHPAIAIAEFMRLLVDEHHLAWDDAWGLTQRSFAYTNHTLLPEALETWPLDLFGRSLPRHLQIIMEINGRFLDSIRPLLLDDPACIARLSLIDDQGPERRIRMANLACVGSFSINGVAALHSDLLKHTVLADFYRLWPEKFHNVTNGVTPRRFIGLANRPLGALLDESIGPGWLRDLNQLHRLEAYAAHGAFQQKWGMVKRSAKVSLAHYIKETTGHTVDPDSLFDVQAKRIHEYKRQHLSLLQVVSLYLRIKHTPGLEMTPRTYIYAGKAAPGYRMAKLIIKLANAVAEVVNHDPATRDRLRVVFVPNMNVRTAQWLYPAADLSEQISTAGKEASGTGNMKFSMNGALTIGTMDGANVEIRDAVGAENFFLFGHTVESIRNLMAAGYHSRETILAQPELRATLDLIGSGLFSHGDRSLFAPLLENLWNHDPYLVCADFADYVAKQDQVDRAYAETSRWTQMSILNTARMGYFSSDRAIQEYARQIWNVVPVGLTGE